jgi:hypothetical protein
LFKNKEAPMRVIAVDWSGAAAGAERRIWLAEAAPPDRLLRLENGRTRDAITQHLKDYTRNEPNTIIGLDFAFSAPDWFLQQLDITSAKELWARARADGERWLKDQQPPWWGRKGHLRPEQEHFRKTEQLLRATRVWPKSIFQVGGAGAVGTGSIRGMPLLSELQAAGAHIWPFDPPGLPLVVEIYPRLLTGPVVKSNTAARQQHFTLHHPCASDWHIPSEDAFDAAVSALAMAAHLDELLALPSEIDPVVRREGRIWRPRATV